MNIELKEFLKKCSTIPNSFIDDFYEIQIENNLDSEFKIDLDIVIKWLGVTKGSIKRTVVKTYVKNMDYTLQKIRGSHGGSPKEKIMMTNDCFKRICMLSRTEKAETVRSYFISLEKLVDKYKDHIIKYMEERIGKLENNQKPKINYESGIIYVFKTDKDIDNVYRIGRTKKFRERLKSHNSSHRDDIEVVLAFETKNPVEVEGCLKAVLKSKQYRKRKVVYEVDLDVTKKVLDQCESVTLIAKSKPNKFKQTGGYYLMLLKNE